MLTALSKLYRLDINLDFKGLAGLHYFPNLFYLGNLTFAHPHCHSLLRCCRRAAHPPPTCALSLPPASGVLLCTVLTNCSICSPSRLFLLCQVPHWHHPSPTPVPDGHHDVHYYVKYFLVFKIFWTVVAIWGGFERHFSFVHTSSQGENPHTCGCTVHEKTARTRALQLQWQHLSADQLETEFCSQVMGAFSNSDGNELMKI